MAWAVILGRADDRPSQVSLRPLESFVVFVFFVFFPAGRQKRSASILPISPLRVWFLVMTTMSQPQLRRAENDEGLGYWSQIDHPDQWALLFHFYGKCSTACFFFPPLLLMSRHSKMTLEEISDRAKPICISYRVGWTHGKAHKSLFFLHTSALPLCRQRSKATAGSVRKDNPNLLFTKQGRQLCLLFRNWLIQSLRSDQGGN